jgi:hypothetical protein
MKYLLLLMALTALAASAADVNGTWKGTADTPNGPIERTFVFKAEGSKLTGESTSSMFGKSAIEDGKIEGDNISFTITVNLGGNEEKVHYKGTVADDEIKLKAEIPALGQTIEYTVKRVS